MATTAAETKLLFKGDFSCLSPPQSNTVRIFISSTFGDFIQERNELMKKVFPTLRTYCHQNGLEFEVVDMRWGVRDESISSHLTSDICIEEIINCQKLSLGPTFVAFLGNRYGYRPLPSQISLEHFNILMETAATTSVDTSLLQTWYKRDDNALPPVYQLQPITTHFENYHSSDSLLRQHDRNGWWATFSLLQQLTWRLVEQSVVSMRMSAEVAHTFLMSVTEDEITQGVFKLAKPDQHCLCYMRDLEGLHSSLTDDRASRYIDLTESSLNFRAQDLLDSLKHEKLPARLSPDNIRHFTVPWRAGGIDAGDANHAAYLSKFCDSVLADLKALINRALSAQGEAADKLRDEVHHHASFCLSKCESFHGRHNVLARVQSHLNAKNGLPLIIHGVSGSGKTSVMAMIASNALRWLGDPSTCILRFLGTSPSSSNLRDALASVCSQVGQVYSLPLPAFDHMDTTQIVQFFRSHLLDSLALLKDERILILLDSVDQLSSADGAYTLNWLPKTLPANVSVIISMLPDRYGCLDTMRSILPAEHCYIQVDAMPVATGIDILSAWLNKARRTITPAQQDIVSCAFSSHPQPLYLKLLFQLAHRWKSYTDPKSIVIPDSTSSALQHLFDWLEEKHGKTLVCHTLGFLSAAKNGLTEAELEDVLSLDDEVLDDVYQYWDPPVTGVIRIPPLIWKRIKHDISDYLVHQHADGMTVLVWYHRQFVETTFHRYLGRNSDKAFFHSILASFFEGEYSGAATKLVNLSNRGITMCAVSRQVSSQPLRFSEDVHNLRKLSEFPFHLVHSNKLEKLKELSLCNFTWMLCKLSATSYTALVRDYTLGLSVQCDQDLSVISECLALSAHNLQKDPTSLAGQLLGRLSSVRDSTSSRHIVQLLDQARVHTLSSPSCQLVPRNNCLISPGGCLKTTLAGHPQLVQQLCATKKQLLVSASKGQSLAVFNIWDVSDMDCVQNLHTVTIQGVGAPQLAVCGNLAAGSCDCSVTLWSCRTGEQLHSHHFPSEVTSLVLSPDEKQVFVGTKGGAICSMYLSDGGRCIEIPTLHKEAVTSLTVTGDCSYLIVASKDGTVSISRITSLQEAPRYIQSHTGAVTCSDTIHYCGSPIVATGSEDKNVSVINLTDGSVRYVLKGHTRAVKCLCCVQPSDKHLIVTGSLDKSIRVWDIESGTCMHTLTQHVDAIWCLTVLKHNALVVSGSKDDYLKVWDPVSGRCLHTLEGHSSWVSCVTVIGRDTVISGSNDKSIKVWRLKQEQFALLERHSTQPESIAAPQKDIIVSGSPTEIKFWSTADGVCLKTQPLSASTLVSDCKILLSGAKNGTITVWNLETLEVLTQLEGHSDAVSCIKLICIKSSKSLLALSASADSTVRKWNVTTSSHMATLSGHTKGVRCVAISADQSLAASGSDDCSIRVWRLMSDDCSCELTGHRKTVGCVAFSRGNSTVISGSDDCTLRVWSVEQGTVLHTISYTDSVKCLAEVSPSLVVAGAHCGLHQLRSWSLDSGELRSDYTGHTHAVMCMLVLERGKYLVTGSRDGTVKVWEAATAQLLASFDLQSQVKHLATTDTLSDPLLAATTKSGPIAIIHLKLPCIDNNNVHKKEGSVPNS